MVTIADTEKKFTVRDLYEEVRKLCKEFPDAVYWGETNPNTALCKYHSGLCTNGQAGCIIGQALGRLGASYEDLSDLTNCGSLGRGETRSSILELLSRGMTYGPRELEDENMFDFLTEVQTHQDKHHPWGECWKFADGKFPYLRPVRT